MKARKIKLTLKLTELQLDALVVAMDHLREYARAVAAKLIEAGEEEDAVDIELVAIQLRAKIDGAIKKGSGKSAKQPTQDGIVEALRRLGGAADPITLLHAFGLTEQDYREALVVQYERSLAELEHVGTVEWIYGHYTLHGSELENDE
jgi:hypothetical protein